MVLAFSSLANRCLATVSAARRFSPARLSNAATSPAQSLSASAPTSLSADSNELDTAAKVKSSKIQFFFNNFLVDFMFKVKDCHHVNS